MENANSYYLLLTYLILKKNTNENKSLSADKVASIIKTEFRMDKKIDKRTIVGHFKRLESLSEQAIDENISFFDDEIITEGEEARVIHNFDASEIKLLADIISFSKLVGKNYSYELIKKIFSLNGENIPYHYEEQLRNKFHASNYNPQLFLSLEEISKAIQKRNKVEVTYLKYDMNYNWVPYLNNNGVEEKRIISPHSIVWSKDFYYVLCTFEDTLKVYFLRADQMKNVKVLGDRKVISLPGNFNIQQYIQTQPHLFGGFTETFSFQAKKWLLKQIGDSFGTATKVEEVNGDEILVKLESSYEAMKVWLMQYIIGITDIYPEKLKRDIKKTLNNKLETL
ncbi:WYL domain-containing protein [Robertmurraya massiliosenegalensis]|uniref:WYL domain-containing protein n=1 Tax=Robertmurraya TaxID=2837507 RepID=UPI0039A67DFB